MNNKNLLLLKQIVILPKVTIRGFYERFRFKEIVLFNQRG